MIKTAAASIRTGSLKVILTDLKFGQKCKLIITFYLENLDKSEKSEQKTGNRYRAKDLGT